MHHCIMIKRGNCKDIEHRVFKKNQRNAKSEAQVLMFSQALHESAEPQPS